MSFHVEKVLGIDKKRIMATSDRQTEKKDWQASRRNFCMVHKALDLSLEPRYTVGLEWYMCLNPPENFVIALMNMAHLIFATYVHMTYVTSVSR